MPINLIKFFQPGYFFDLRPTIDLKTIYFLAAVFGALILAAIIIKIVQPAKKELITKKLLQKYFLLCLVMGLVGLVLVGFRYETALILAARFWLVLWALGFVIWLVLIVKYQWRVVPQVKEKLEQKKIFQKYLPRKK